MWREEEEKARKFKGKEKLEDSPLPSPKHLHPSFFPKDIPSFPIITEGEIQFTKQQENESHQKEIATLIALVDHYKNEAQDYEQKFLEENTKMSKQQELILRFTS